MTKTVVLASRNEHKQQEFAVLLPNVTVELLPAGCQLPPETGTTYIENAVAKARAGAAATGQACFADDSGIEAAALGGRPGVRSARYAGERATDADNLAKLLEEVPPGSALEYVCVIAYVDPVSQLERTFTGRCKGRRADRPTGRGGFGYDPAFLPVDAPPGVTMAELTAKEKNAISHRGKAAQALLNWLEL